MPVESPEPLRDAASTSRSLWALLGILALLAVLAGGTVWFLTRFAAGGTEGSRGPVTAAGAAARIPFAGFADVTRTAGITFRHVNGAAGGKYLPETMGGGVAFFDFNADGRPDLLFINSTWWPEDPRSREGSQPTLALYRNETVPGGEPRFTDVTAGSGLDIPFYGMGVAIGDYDNDGLPDVYVTAVGLNHLFHNLGNGRFEDVTARAGVGGAGGPT